MDCTRYLDAAQRRWDGEPEPVPTDLDRHLAECPTCRSWEEAVQRFDDGLAALRAGTLVVPPAGLSARIVAAVSSDRRKRLRFRRFSGAAAVAASLVLAVLAGRHVTQTRHAAPVVETAAVTPAPAEEPDVRLSDGLSAAGSAVAQLSRATAAEAVAQTVILLPVVPERTLPVATIEQTLTPAASTLREASQTVSVGLEPVTYSARRAFAMFVRELPTAEPERKQGL